jgi:CspA family cold shock protein
MSEQPAKKRAEPRGGGLRGTVKWYDAERGFGFIARAGGKDVFVHARDLEHAGIGTLSGDQPVEFEIGQEGTGRLYAINLKVKT